ncbi:TrkA family potassium uptake protein [Marinobacter sp. M3C]|uniref:potassium channel family protein n=1 Tax=unclassified Marinobacter TaxID=83889 RepID=UPI002010857E|nr:MULTISPECIES: NAD-binding protein [unclassified Marinobacter]MCL1488918.1 TrkA family potassium uptake protein [Marinobacter sp.]UQG57188.1 TrkA family potassium uptake protein [Marinobacter sp. M4C]UQG61629.1 TrkA family potassium uptake protein [Marinobacter sp. M3C]UQG65992.1 TrkA family potassium uptake protein [Marinobacter sp. M2C]UQG70272.1 TrkA family potassium uptake protein [Marinobacter sp. M1C]
MVKKQQVIVIGLGVFGTTVAQEMTRLGHDVLGLDIDEQRVDRLAQDITHAVIADVTDESALIELNAGNYDVGVVAIGRNAEATMLATLQLHELGVKKIWAKALSLQHHRILERLGATRVISPEHEMGVRISQELNYPMVHDYLSLGDDYFVVEFQTTKDLIGKTVGDLIGNLPVSALVAKRMKTAHTHPDTSWDIQSGDRLVLGGQLNDLRALIHRL